MYRNDATGPVAHSAPEGVPAAPRGRAEERYRALFENAMDAISVLTPEGVIVEVNPRWEDILRVPAAQLIGRHISEVSAPGHEDANTARFLARVEGGGGRDEAVPLQRSDGVTVYVEFSVNVIQVNGEPLCFCIGRDATERVLAGMALQAAEEKYRALVERMPEAVWTTDSDGRITYMSPNVVNICGYSAEEMCAEGPATRRNRIHPEDRALVVNAFDALFKNRKSFDVEYRRRRKNGTWAWLRLRAAVGHDRNGTRIVEGLLSDVTDRRHLEEQLRHAQKMEAVGTLAGGVAHDFNNMLNVLLGYTMMLLDGMPSDHPMYDALSEMRRAGERSADLTRQLLAFSRQEPQEVQLVDVNAAVKGVEKLARRVVGENIEIDSRLSLEECTIHADPGQMDQILMNLVVNARDAMPAGGRLTFETSVATCEDARTLHGEMRPGRYAVLAVKDTGVGMTKETQARIFEPFFTTKEFGKGTGLGLSIVFGIVRQYGGHIGVETEPGQGTTFRVYLPLGSVDASAPIARRSTRSPSSGRETILLVEDEEQVRKVAEIVLRRSGYEVLVARDPKEAVSLHEQHADEIALLLTDVMMPHVTGPELAQRLLEKTPKMKVVYMSGYTDMMPVVRRGLSGVALLQKPISPHVLNQSVRAALDAADGEPQ